MLLKRKNETTIIGTILVFLNILSCTDTIKNNNLPRNQNITNKSGMNSKYLEAKRFFKEEFVDHFPPQLDSTTTGFDVSFSSEYQHLRLVLINLCDERKIDSLSLIYSDLSIAHYSAGDSCLLVTNRFTTADNWFKNIIMTPEQKKIINKDCYNFLYPIPNFYESEFATQDTECRLPVDFNLYVLESKAGKFMGDEYLTRGRFMPSKWRNGYSKGVSISTEKNIIIYWFIIW